MLWSTPLEANERLKPRLKTSRTPPQKTPRPTAANNNPLLLQLMNCPIPTMKLKSASQSTISTTTLPSLKSKLRLLNLLIINPSSSTKNQPLRQIPLRMQFRLLLSTTLSNHPTSTPNSLSTWPNSTTTPLPSKIPLLKNCRLSTCATNSAVSAFPRLNSSSTVLSLKLSTKTSKTKIKN